MSKDLYTLRESKTYPGLFVKKYSRHVFYDNLWNDELMECRGHVVDANGATVINPFTKIFNRFENGTDIHRDAECVAIRKVNGFMASLTYVPLYKKSIVSTTGSLDSDFVKMAESMIPRAAVNFCDLHYHHPITFLFEIVHVDDPHIIAEEPGAYLIGARRVDKTTPYHSTAVDEMILDDVATRMKVMRPNHFTARFSDIVEEAKECQHEGFVVYSEDKSLKIKSPFYLTTKFLGRLSKSKMTKLAENPLSLKQQIDEEFYPILESINLVKDQFINMTEQERMAFLRNELARLQCK